MRRDPEGLARESSSGSTLLTGTLTVDRDRETHAEEDREEDTGLLGLWHERAIDLRRLSRPLSLTVAVSILAALMSAALIMLRDVPQAHLLIPGDQTNEPIPTAAFAVAFVLWVIAWSAVLTGAMFGHWALRLFVAVTFLYISILSAQLHSAIELTYLAPLVVVALWMVVISLLQWRWHGIARSLPRWLPAVTCGVVLICLAAHYAIVWWVANLAHVATKYVTLLVLNEFQAYTFVLVPVLFLTGSDFAEWAEAVAGQSVALLRRFRSAWPLAGATSVVALAILVHELIEFGTIAHFGLAWALHLVMLGIYGGIVILLLVGIMRLGKVGSWPRLAVPPAALVAATVISMSLLVAPVYLTSFLFTVNSYLPNAPPEPPLASFLQNLYSQLTAPIVFGIIPLAFGLLLGIPLLVRGRRRPGPLAVAGLFLTVFGLLEALTFLPQILAVFGVPTNRIILFALGGQDVRLSQIPTLSVPVLQMLAAFFTLVIAGWLVVRRRIGDERATRVLAALLLLDAGLQIISWIDVVLGGTDQLSNRFTVAQGVLLVLAFLWDLLTSGAQVTNVQGRRTPRFARVLLYVGYSMLSFALVLFFTSIKGSSFASFLDGWPDTGMVTLGIPLLLTVVLMRLARSGVTNEATRTRLGGNGAGTLEQAVDVRSSLEPVGSLPRSPSLPA